MLAAVGAGDGVTGGVSGNDAAAAVGDADGVVGSSNEGGAVNASKSASVSTRVGAREAAAGTVPSGTSGGSGAGGAVDVSPQTTRGKEVAEQTPGAPAPLVPRVHKGRSKHDRAKSHHHRKPAFVPRAPRMTAPRMYADPPTPPPRSSRRRSRTWSAAASASPIPFEGDDVHGALVVNPAAQVEAAAEPVVANPAALDVVGAVADVGDSVVLVEDGAHAMVGDPVAATMPRGPGKNKRKAPTASDEDAGDTGMGP